MERKLRRDKAEDIKLDKKENWRRAKDVLNCLSSKLLKNTRFNFNISQPSFYQWTKWKTVGYRLKSLVAEKSLKFLVKEH